MELIRMDNSENGTCRGVDEGSDSSSSSSSYGAAAISRNDALEVMIDPGMESSGSKLYPKRRIEKVPLTMRKDEKTKGYFDPRVVSIGPYHHGKEELQTVERIKPIIAQLFISSSGRRMDEFREHILEIVDDARSCYVDGSTDKYSDDEFAEMMLLDGLFACALIESITPGYGDQTIEDEIVKHLGKHALYLLPSDITSLLENQLPFQVLELLMILKSKNNKLTEMMDKFLDSLESRESQRQDKKELGTEFRWLLDNKSGIDKKQPLHYLEYIWLRHNNLSQSDQTRGTLVNIGFSDFYYSFKSVSELKAKGIHARSGSVYTQRDFKFKSFFFFAVLEIPPLILNPQFIIHTSNQIAYEWTPNNPNNLPTMAYMNFMKSLINSVEDVKELRAKNILFSACTSDEEVVKMFNSISTFGVEDFRIYDKVKRKIQHHYNNKARTWFAELIHKYFSSPWTFMAFIAAAVIVSMSFLQTYYTIFPRA
ncbi:hypothetical protein RHMOL_Rhmol03G0065200 [Rhododendron molle]|uniref:Uncharacterized protein n=1 Tax=Rhododendron molle TaxID=49168 RepID=A0ACC0PCQ0_RHOML|nr:hypothetical protein RHMOL_Rhmol03G0065200 [Rhododendron molle]